MQDTGHHRLSELLSAALGSHGHKLAIEDSNGAWSLTYEALSERASSALRWLETINAGTVVLCLEKTADFYALEVACFTHGVDFCPIDPINPPQRIAAIVTQLPDPIVVCDRPELIADLESIDIEVVQPWERRRLAHKASSLRKPHLPRYYIATSGSTGVPKIVIVPFLGVIDFLEWSIPYYQVDASTRWAQYSSVGFDLSIVDLLTVLLGGGALISIASNFHRIRPAIAIAEAKITHWHSVPSIISYLLKDTRAQRFPVRFFSFCGEPLHSIEANDLSEAYPGASIVNTYGPTEGTLYCSYHAFKSSDTACATVPIGRPIPGWDFIWLRDDENYFRLIITSENLAEGYVGQNSENFSKVKIFRNVRKVLDTGDYFLLSNGEYFFSHRKDSLKKISGNRLDLGEVEAAAKSVGYSSPVCFVDGNKIHLVVEEADSDVRDDRLAKLRALLPKYAVPSKVNFSPMHPRTPNGKIDRNQIIKGVRSRNE